MPAIDLGYTARRQFYPIHDSRKRWKICVAHRGAGKTVSTINELIAASCECGMPEPRHFYIAPYYRQAKDIAWPYLKRYTAPIPGVTVNESELRVDLPGGRRLQMFGADNYERLRGMHPDGVALDEYGDMDPRAWQEVIRPSLSVRNGWAIFIGTPKGLNHFAELWREAEKSPDWLTLRLRASDTGLLSERELADARLQMSEEQYAAEYECSFEASVIGSVFGRQIEETERDGRITAVPWQPEFAVSTWWDIGTSDSTAIWFTQDAGREVHVIDYLEDAGSGKGIDYYLKQLQGKPYTWGSHNGPHDFASKSFAAGGRSSQEIAAGLGFRFNIVPRIDQKHNSINAGRVFMKRCWFDKTKCERGLKCLRSYHYEWNEKNKIFSSEPKHDWSSNGSDAFQSLAMGHKSVTPAQFVKREPEYRPMPRGSEDRQWMAL